MPSKRPSTDWRELIVDAAAGSGVRKIITTGLRLDDASNRVIRRAAERRGMSPAAYIRRSAVAFALHDLGQDENWDRVNADEPGFTAYGRPMGKAPYRPDGHGFGPWRILGLRKHHDDD
jgi:hypothetical protein